ncbi:hypothetical protein AVEN_221368-1 [Araneus ventricosus]|uniref:Uncharacterized protein n=1 Tax=Araneus ventricosus TaxID=182803 RepID=A0A4Y2AYJ1_ARAVE|nr:hypothetical protein AVEN_221368-1 [Araneus ventricosus]
MRTAPDVVFSELMIVTMPQEQFLSNGCNKGRFIAMLSVKLENEGFLIEQATENVNHLIVTSRIVADEEHKCAVLGEDIDLLVILTVLASPSANIFSLENRERKLTKQSVLCQQF